MLGSSLRSTEHQAPSTVFFILNSAFCVLHSGRCLHLDRDIVPFIDIPQRLAAWTAEPRTPIDYRYTGTTNDSRDNWFMGSTPDLTVGIFIGFDDPRSLGSSNMETGGGNAVPIYKRIADVVFKDKPPVPFKVPPGLRMIRWSYEGGTIDEVFKPGTEPGGDLAAGTGIDSANSAAGVDGTTGRPSGGGGGGGAGRPTLSGTGETY